MPGKRNTSHLPPDIINGIASSAYARDLDAESVIKTLERQIRPSFVELLSAEEIDLFSNKEPFVIVGFFVSRTSAEYEYFTRIATQHREQFLFGIVVNNSEATTKFSLPILPAIILFKQYDEKRIVLGQEDLNLFESNVLEEAIMLHRFPLLGQINRENSRAYIESGIPIVFVFISSSEERDQLTPMLKSLASETGNRLHFVFIDWKQYGDQSRKLGLSGNQVPSIAIEDTKKQLHYAYSEQLPISDASLRPWIFQFLENQLKPSLVSQSLEDILANDQDHLQDSMVTLVGSNFESIVMNPSKDVFVEFYAPCM